MDVPLGFRSHYMYRSRQVNVQANSKSLNDEAILGAVQRLRVICAFAKVEATVELVRTILNDEPAVVIFSNFAQVAKEVHAKLSGSGWPCELLTGETPQKRRQTLVDNFQSGLSSVFICTFGAGGVGLTLTAAATIILLDRPWTPGETRQAEDRIRRIGQDRDCKSYWMRSFDLDRQIDDMLESKRQATNAVLNRNDGTAAVMSGPTAKISISKLVSSILMSASRQQRCDGT
jgi:SNF2 family DNA or RNA helicase